MNVKQKPLKGKVIRGDQLASLEFGVPTANLDIQPDLDYGVFAAKATYGGKTYNAAVCYGVGEPPKFEVHMFDFSKDILGEEVEVEIVGKVSELIDWHSKERMRQKIMHDLELVQKKLGK